MTHFHAADVGFGDVGVDLHLGEVLRDREERRRLQAGGDRLPDVDGARDDDAVDRRDDDRVLELISDCRRLACCCAARPWRSRHCLGPRSCACADVTDAAWARSWATVASYWAMAESLRTCAASRSAWAISSFFPLFLAPDIRLPSTTPTCALTVCA
jgi:hypothetical protein